jgi:hypothetical protein
MRKLYALPPKRCILRVRLNLNVIFLYFPLRSVAVRVSCFVAVRRVFIGPEISVACIIATPERCGLELRCRTAIRFFDFQSGSNSETDNSISLALVRSF